MGPLAVLSRSTLCGRCYNEVSLAAWCPPTTFVVCSAYNNVAPLAMFNGNSVECGGCQKLGASGRGHPQYVCYVGPITIWHL